MVNSSGVDSTRPDADAICPTAGYRERIHTRQADRGYSIGELRESAGGMGRWDEDAILHLREARPKTASVAAGASDLSLGASRCSSRPQHHPSTHFRDSRGVGRYLGLASAFVLWIETYASCISFQPSRYPSRLLLNSLFMGNEPDICCPFFWISSAHRFKQDVWCSLLVQRCLETHFVDPEAAQEAYQVAPSCHILGLFSHPASELNEIVQLLSPLSSRQAWSPQKLLFARDPTSCPIVNQARHRFTTALDEIYRYVLNEDYEPILFSEFENRTSRRHFRMKSVQGMRPQTPFEGYQEGEADSRCGHGYLIYLCWVERNNLVEDAEHALIIPSSTQLACNLILSTKAPWGSFVHCHITLNSENTSYYFLSFSNCLHQAQQFSRVRIRIENPFSSSQGGGSDMCMVSYVLNRGTVKTYWLTAIFFDLKWHPLVHSIRRLLSGHIFFFFNFTVPHQHHRDPPPRSSTTILTILFRSPTIFENGHLTLEAFPLRIPITISFNRTTLGDTHHHFRQVPHRTRPILNYPLIPNTTSSYIAAT
ncbi:uncharacterized protein BDR25DRAFT_391058 [Lindgomyces ingoldianus]|uniref:Uncharacterized protein n=1 Tax=Lindgomyces ingoldianus TaxID=673940 RepID=A0ACB6RE37_9PLEO|nr:uncharacterized protein BDR25DRAFT_391058 [Lindgomyces ingoldianus]KAF2476585.1 hypothetical protein BDR25DRAFT_391058 [Lindgomyces ingoldianus]